MMHLENLGGVSSLLLPPLTHYRLLGLAGVELEVVLVAASQVLTFSLFAAWLPSVITLMVVVSSANLMTVLVPCVSTRSCVRMWLWPSTLPCEEDQLPVTGGCC